MGEDSRSSTANQPVLQIPDDVRKEIMRAIGPERFATYIKAASTDTRALQLYELNSRLSGPLHEVIGGFEVALRNRVSQSIAEHFHREDWYRCRAFTMRLSPERRDNIREVRRRIRSDGLDERPGRIIAGLTFHFWVALHENKYRDTIWTPYLHRIWPKGTNIKNVHKDILKIRDLRNRIAHHEPIFLPRWNGRMDQVWQRFEELAPEKAQWFRTRCEPAIIDLSEACRSLAPSRPL
jgi:hypothetical protein